MALGSILLGAALLLLVGLFLARPFLLANARYGRQRSLRQELLAQKEAVLTQIQILEFDYETGTMPEQDYEQQRRQMVAEAAEILKKLDELPEAAGTYSGDEVDKEIEAAVARLRQPPPVAPTPQSQTPVPANGQIEFCSQCGRPVEEEDNFCAYCGHKIIQPQPT